MISISRVSFDDVSIAQLVRSSPRRVNGQVRDILSFRRRTITWRITFALSSFSEVDLEVNIFFLEGAVYVVRRHVLETPCRDRRYRSPYIYRRVLTFALTKCVWKIGTGSITSVFEKYERRMTYLNHLLDICVYKSIERTKRLKIWWRWTNGSAREKSPATRETLSYFHSWFSLRSAQRQNVIYFAYAKNNTRFQLLINDVYFWSSSDSYRIRRRTINLRRSFHFRLNTTESGIHHVQHTRSTRIRTEYGGCFYWTSHIYTTTSMII